MRPWVETLEGRDAHLGSKLDCVLCDRLEIPDLLKPYKRTREFTEGSIPKGLLKEHATKKGVWGQIFVLDGKLEYTVEYPEKKIIEIAEGGYANISPEAPHSVKAKGKVRFYVEFFKDLRATK
jgi:tellurite methyltransferase